MKTVFAVKTPEGFGTSDKAEAQIIVDMMEVVAAERGYEIEWVDPGQIYVHDGLEATHDLRQEIFEEACARLDENYRVKNA